MDLKFTSTKNQLSRALAVAKVGASIDKTLPLLHGVNITVTAREDLVVQGTDRYLAVRALLAPKGAATHTHALTEGKLTIGLQTLGLIQKWLTLVDKAAPVVVTWTEEDGLSVSATDAPTLSGVAPIEGIYPNLERLMRSGEVVDQGIHDRAGAVTLSSHNTTKLGTIAGHFRRHVPVLLRPGTKASTNDLMFRITDGDRILVDGIIMGVLSNTDNVIHQHGL